ncbi:hypothetical protein ScPMuIL_009239 [Solemya velum]
MTAISASHIALLMFAFSTIWAQKVKDCEKGFQNCMNKDQSNLNDCALEMFGCLRKHCDRMASLARTTKQSIIYQIECYAKHGIVTLLDL